MADFSVLWRVSRTARPLRQWLAIAGMASESTFFILFRCGETGDRAGDRIELDGLHTVDLQGRELKRGVILGVVDRQGMFSAPHRDRVLDVGAVIKVTLGKKNQ